MKTLNNCTKTTEKLLLVLALVLLALVARSEEKLPTIEQIEAWQIPCEHIENGCIEYALGLAVVLHEKGIPARLVVYGRGTVHAVVLFELQGKTYLIDNETDKANRVKGKNDLQRVQSFDGLAVCLKEPSTAYGPEVAVYLVHLAKARAEGKY